MDKLKEKYRDIQFFSKKNGRTVSVHSRDARLYAGTLEDSPNVSDYECCVPLEGTHLEDVGTTGIRQEYLRTDWATDFLVDFSDGSRGIREAVRLEDLVKRSMVEKLELSRRYWKRMDVTDWKIVIVDKGDVYVL